jgi:hypothetical protein
MQQTVLLPWWENRLGEAMRKLFILNLVVFALVTVATGTVLATTLSSNAVVVFASQ